MSAEAHAMKHVLFVDDDQVVLRLYQQALSQRGLRVQAAADGLAAIQSLRVNPPDLVVLDLMMPKFSGVDVLKFIRSTPALKELPVIVLSNSYMSELAEQAVAVGVQQALLKTRCTPNHLAGVIDGLLVKKQPAPAPEPPTPQSDATPAPPAAAAEETKSPELNIQAARLNLFANALKIRAELHSLGIAFAQAQNDTERGVRLQNLCRRVHFLTASAALAECHQIALLTSAFEALLFEMMQRPDVINASVRRTVAFTVDFLGLLLERAQHIDVTTPVTPQVLVVDDDPLANRLISAALERGRLSARTTENPAAGLEWAQQIHFDLFLLDVEMPDLNGFELCKQIRALPGYARTPVIFVTSHADFEHRSQSILSGGNDLISKPVLPIELTVKAITHLLRSNLEAHSATS
ncbi:MAG TPA: response regulator [Verrucomicrobiae bacterium]|nr:response regulator [Verrucomicrobiae bacterium]